LLDVQRQSLPELSRAPGRIGLHLRPVEQDENPPKHELARIVVLHRAGQGFAGALRCQDAGLPFADKSFSLAYAAFVLETCVEPAALMREISRTLEPEGLALIVSLNPFSPSRWQWLGYGISGLSARNVARLARAAGMEVMGWRGLGPVWLGARSATDEWPGYGFNGLRAANLIVARRRETTLTPLRRKPGAALKLRHGMSPG
jgi:SAM-dependent methyltransferase